MHGNPPNRGRELLCVCVSWENRNVKQLYVLEDGVSDRSRGDCAETEYACCLCSMLAKRSTSSKATQREWPQDDTPPEYWTTHRSIFGSWMGSTRSGSRVGPSGGIGSLSAESHPVKNGVVPSLDHGYATTVRGLKSSTRSASTCHSIPSFLGEWCTHVRLFVSRGRSKPIYSTQYLR